MNCINCGTKIPEIRLQAMPGTCTCVNCSSTKRVHGFNVIEHKTGNWVQVVKDPGIFEDLINLDKDKGRGRTGYAGGQ